MQPGISLPTPVGSTIPGLTPAPLQTTVPVQITAQFSSPLRLTPDQEAEFTRTCRLRITELRREMGLTENNDIIPGGWMWLRQCHELYYQGDLTWRKAFGGIFLKSNVTLGSGLRHSRYISARVQDDLLGTEPFFAAIGAKTDKEELAKQVEHYVQEEIEKGGIRDALQEAQKIAIYRNECVVKTGYIQDATPYVGEATVLVDYLTGEPVVTPEKGIFVYQDDQVTPSPQDQNVMLLDSDPSFSMTDHPDQGIVVIPEMGTPGQPDYSPERLGKYEYFPELPQVLVKKQGIYAEGLDYRSFLCPLRVKSLHDADTVVHLYLETPSRLQKIYGGIDCSQQYFAYWNQPGQDKPKHEQGENDQPPTVIWQQIIVAEVYRRCDPDQTGDDKEIFLVMDLTNERPIYYNFLANHMAKRPFESLPGIEKVPGRWYGRGVYGMLDSHLFYEDVEASRSFFKNSQDATIQFAYKNAVEYWKNGQPPEIGTGDTNWVREDWDPEGKRKIIWRENMASDWKGDETLMNTMRQSSDALVGAISTASASESDFNQSKTATGNQLVQQASDIIARATEQAHTAAINLILEQLVDISLEHMDSSMLTTDPDSDQVALVNKNEARHLDRDVRLLLTRSRSTQLLNTSTQALAIAKDYRMLSQTDPAGAKVMRDLYIAQLKGLEVQDADKVCPPVTDQDIAAFQGAQAQAQQGQQKPPAESMAIKMPDLVGNEITQALSKFDIQADQGARQQAQVIAQQQAAAQPPAIHALPAPAQP